jgi:hypothetical protein
MIETSTMRADKPARRRGDARMAFLVVDATRY